MAEFKQPEKEGLPSVAKDSPYARHLDPAAKTPNSTYYNVGVYVLLYNRIKADLMNKFGDSRESAYDISINNQILKIFCETDADGNLLKDGNGNYIIKPEADIKTHLKDVYGIEGNLLNYSTDIKKNPNSVQAFVNDFHDGIVRTARELKDDRNRANSGDKVSMLSVADFRDFMDAKEAKADLPYERMRKLLLNNDVDGNGYDNDGPLQAAWKNAQEKRKYTRSNLGVDRLKALGWFGLTAGGVFLTATLGLGALGIGGQAIAGLFSSIYSSSSFAGVLAGVGGTVGSGAATVGFFGNFLKRIGINYRESKKQRQWRRSRGKMAEAKDNDFENMGYRRLKETYLQMSARKLYFDLVSKNYKEGEPPEYYLKLMDKEANRVFCEGRKISLKKYLIRYMKSEKHEPNGKNTLAKVYKDAMSHRFLACRNIRRDSADFGFYKLRNFMDYGVEGRETANISTDEANDNYEAILTKAGTDAIGLEKLTGMLKDYMSKEADFEKEGKYRKYIDTLKLFGDKLSDEFLNSYFVEPYSQNGIIAIHTIQNGKAVKPYFEGEGAAIATRVESMYAFVNAEEKNTSRNPLSEDVEVGVQYQFDFSENSMVDGCKQLGDESAQARLAAAAIATMSACDYVVSGDGVSAALPTTVEDAINLVGNAKAKKYLRYMAESKLKSTTTATVGHFIVDTESATSTKSIAYRINNLTDTSNADEIRAAIENQFTLGTPAENEAAKKYAYMLLNRQISAIENKKRDDARTKAMYGVQKGSPKFAEIMKEISELEGLDVNKFYDIKNNKILKISPAECRDYLMYKLKDKVYKNMRLYAENKDNFNKEGFNSIRNFLSDIFSFTQNGYIDAWQRDEIMGYLNKERVVPAFDTFLKDAELGFFTESQKDNIAQVRKFIETTLSSGTGFKEYLEMDNPDSKRIKERLERIYKSTYGLRQLVTSSKNVEDPDSPELQAFLKVYFEQDRPSDNKLIKVLTKLKDVSGKIIDKDNLELTTAEKADVDKFDGTGTKTYTDLTGSFVYAINAELAKFSGTGGIHVDLDVKDSMAALIIIKRRVLAKMKEHMAVLRQKHGSNFGTWLTTSDGATYINNMKKQWLKVANSIDSKIFDLLNNYDFDPSYAASNDTASIVNAQFTSATSVQEYVDSKGLGMS